MKQQSAEEEKKKATERVLVEYRKKDADLNAVASQGVDKKKKKAQTQPQRNSSDGLLDANGMSMML